jgi:hypothetical protein
MWWAIASSMSRLASSSATTGLTVTREQEAAQVHLILILSDQLTQVFAASAVATLTDLLIHDGLERVGWGDIRCAQGSR